MHRALHVQLCSEFTALVHVHHSITGKKDRDRVFFFPELMSSLYVVLGTNERFSTGKCTDVRLQTCNTVYTQHVGTTT